MSTITSPRETSVNGRRAGVPQISTPTSSSRPSLEYPRSNDASPSRGPVAPKRNRAALRSYYNLPASSPQQPGEDLKDDASSIHSSIHDNSSDIPESELDHEEFDAQVYVKNVLETQGLGELLKTYNSILLDIRALDAEKKALVYDNYSKLIAATESIGRMRKNMDPLDPMARTVEAAVRGIWEMAGRMKGEVQEDLGGDKQSWEEGIRKENARKVVRRVLDTPERVRVLVSEGREDEAKRVWGETRSLLEKWKERGVGGPDVLDCIEDGDAALKGEPPSEKSWVNIRENRESTS